MQRITRGNQKLGKGMKFSKIKLSFLIIFFILLSDQILKFWIKTHFQLGQEIHVFGNWFIIHFVENNGMAFGFEFAGEYGKMFLSIFRIIAVCVMVWYLLRISRRDAPIGFIVSLSLIIAGAFGNIIDSVFYGLLFDHSFGQMASFLPPNGGYAGFLWWICCIFLLSTPPILTGSHFWEEKISSSSGRYSISRIHLSPPAFSSC
jgi:lipoprotein signal peptidase